MTVSMPSAKTFVLCVLAVSLMAPAINGAVVAKKIPSNAIFYNPKKYTLYHYPAFEFEYAACGPRDDAFQFGVTYDGVQQAYVVKYNWQAYDTQPQAQLQAFKTIKLNLKTGALSFASYGSFISVNLKTYFKTDYIQKQSQTQNSKTVWGQDLYVQDPIANVASPVLVDLDRPVVAALRMMSKAATTFAKVAVPYECREKKTTPGSVTLKTLAAYLQNLSTLPEAKW